MSNILQILSKKGTLTNIPAGRRVRIDPELRAPSAIISPASVGDPDFQATDSPPLTPDTVKVSTGFQVTEINRNTASALFGCFDVQNITNHAATLDWEAIWFMTQQLDPNQVVRTTVGEDGEGGGSPAGLDPIAIQGASITRHATIPTVNLLIEQANIRINILINDAQTLIVLPTMPTVATDQDGMEVTLKNYTTLRAEFRPAVGQLIDGFFSNPPIPGSETFFLDPTHHGQQAVTFEWDGPNNTWLWKSHFHYPVYNV